MSEWERLYHFINTQRHTVKAYRTVDGGKVAYLLSDLAAAAGVTVTDEIRREVQPYCDYFGEGEGFWFLI